MKELWESAWRIWGHVMEMKCALEESGANETILRKLSSIQSDLDLILAAISSGQVREACI